MTEHPLREAAQAVAADAAQPDWEVLDALQGLRDKSLVQTVPGKDAVPPLEETNCKMGELA